MAEDNMLAGWLFLKANSCFQLKENGNSLGFNLVADIVAVVNLNQVVQW